METTIFKFGGASVHSATGFLNVARILRREPHKKVIVVLSAMGKTTNDLEQVADHFMKRDALAVVESFNVARNKHFAITGELFPDRRHPVYGEMESLFDQLRGYIRKGHLYTAGDQPYDFEYDQIVSFGELFSTTMLYHLLAGEGMHCKFLDARELIKTDQTYRDARVDWDQTRCLVTQAINEFFDSGSDTLHVAVLQGFIGSDAAGNTTTLGREGSDFTAAILAFSLGVSEVTIWKDVPGVMNADPKWRPDATVLSALSYREAIELSYYGASVIHPKTIKPLENAGIRLKVRSFVDPELPGTTIESLDEWTITTPIFIRKQNQVLISLSPRDFSFIVEENISEIFRILSISRVRVNMMQNSAISLSVSVDDDQRKIKPLIETLSVRYQVRYNHGLDLYTIRHYLPDTLQALTGGREILLEQRSRHTLQVVVKT